MPPSLSWSTWLHGEQVLDPHSALSGEAHEWRLHRWRWRNTGAWRPEIPGSRDARRSSPTPFHPISSSSSSSPSPSQAPLLPHFPIPSRAPTWSFAAPPCPSPSPDPLQIPFPRPSLPATHFACRIPSLFHLPASVPPPSIASVAAVP